MFNRAASIVDQLDVFLGYAGVRMSRKIWLAYFRTRNASEVLENARVVYREHYARRGHLVAGTAVICLISILRVFLAQMARIPVSTPRMF
jgi:hypothetical protein